MIAVERIVNPLAPGHLLALALAGAVGVIGNAIAARIRLAGGRRLDQDDRGRRPPSGNRRVSCGAGDRPARSRDRPYRLSPRPATG